MDREFRPYYNYMPYSFYNQWNDVYEERRDIEYMKRMYPQTMRELQDIVEDECDKMEYDGSTMFDEYPDKVRINMIVNRIYSRNSSGNADTVTSEERGGDNCLIKDIIAVMLCNEMYKRRCRRRRRKYFY